VILLTRQGGASHARREKRNPDFFLDFTFQWLYKIRMQQSIVAISINDGRENRNHGNEEKGKEEKEVRALRQKRMGRPSASPKFFCELF
jgi:hypothetical protein